MIKTEIYNKLLTSQKNNGTSFCVLIDPDEHSVESLESFVKAINKAKVDVILVGGSLHLGDASAHKYQIIKIFLDQTDFFSENRLVKFFTSLYVG